MTAKRFQKLLFLLTRKQEKKAYDFLPYKYGSYSFQASQDLHVMEKMGFVKITDNPDGNVITLENIPDEASEVSIMDSHILDFIKAKFGDMSQDEIIRYTYVNYPFYATKSVLAETLLSAEELAKVRKQERHLTVPMLFTIGYEGISLEAYVNTLIIKDVRILCDVRKNAFSQKYGFTKGVLQKAVEGVGIKYLHVPELGIESDERQDLLTQEDYDRLFERYEATTLKENWEYIVKLRDIINSYHRVALTCFEANPNQCHRSRVAKALMSFHDKDYKLFNIINAKN